MPRQTRQSTRLGQATPEPEKPPGKSHIFDCCCSLKDKPNIFSSYLDTHQGQALTTASATSPMSVHQAQNPMTTSGASPMSVHQAQNPMTTSGPSPLSVHQAQNPMTTAGSSEESIGKI